MIELDAPRSEDAEAIGEFRTVLDRHEFTPEAIQRAFGSSGGFTRELDQVPLYLRRLEQGTPLSTLIKLFLLDVWIPSEEAEAAFAPLTLERVEGLGVVRSEDGRTQATLNLFPNDEVVIAADQYEARGAGRPDHVLGLSISSRVLSALTLRDPVLAALDLGTGSGIQALGAARHATWVVATDINPRAVRFAEFNQRLNRVENLEVREGSLFEPVEGSAFGLIVANPPYVISPDTDYVFRDSGRPGDSFAEELVRRAPEFLVEGGTASILVEWAIRAGEEWSQPLRRWVADGGCDAVLLHYVSQDPLAYAATWNHELLRDSAAYAAALDRWVDYDRGLDVERIGWGAIVLRKRTVGPANWVRPLAHPGSRVGTAEHHLRRIFAAQDYITALGPGRGLLDGVFRPAEDHRFEQAFTLDDGRVEMQELVIKLGSGLMIEVPIDTRTLGVLELLDGSRTLGEALNAAAVSMPDEDPNDYLVSTLPAIVRLLELGVVVPAG